MFAPFLLTIVMISTHADDQPDTATLIGRLGAPSFDDRVATYKALEHLGREALPALRAAADASDTRVRSRVRALIESISRQLESDRFARPTTIRLDFRNRPLGEVVDAVNERHDLGLSLRLGPEPRRGMIIEGPGQRERLQKLRDRQITLEAAQPVPFWEAIDRLCQAGALHYDVALRPVFGTGRQGSLVLMGDRTGHGPVSDSGPFRVQISGVHAVFERDFTLDPDQARRGRKPPGAGDLTVTLTVLAAPGLVLHENGPVIVTEATDDRGRSLLPSPPTERDPAQARRAFPVMRDRTTVQVDAALLAPEPSGTVIRRLRGKVPVIAVTRGPDPIVIPLNGDGGVGKPVSTRDMIVVVDEAVLAPAAQVSVKVTVRPNRQGLAPGVRSDPRRPDYTAFDRNRVPEHLELYDAAGRRLDHTLGQQTNGADRQGFFTRYQLIVSPSFDDGPVNGRRTSNTPIPSELRYYGFVQTVTEIPFDFRDVPMP